MSIIYIKYNKINRNYILKYIVIIFNKMMAEKLERLRRDDDDAYCYLMEKEERHFAEQNRIMDKIINIIKHYLSIQGNYVTLQCTDIDKNVTALSMTIDMSGKLVVYDNITYMNTRYFKSTDTIPNFSGKITSTQLVLHNFRNYSVWGSVLGCQSYGNYANFLVCFSDLSQLTKRYIIIPSYDWQYSRFFDRYSTIQNISKSIYYFNETVEEGIRQLIQSLSFYGRNINRQFYYGVHKKNHHTELFTFKEEQKNIIIMIMCLYRYNIWDDLVHHILLFTPARMIMDIIR